MDKEEEEDIQYDEYGREIEYVPPGGHCFDRFKEEMEVFEKELAEWKVQIAEKWKHVEKVVMKL